MEKTKTNFLNKISILFIALILFFSSFLAINFGGETNTVFAEEETGMSISKSFTVSYYKGEKITIDGVETTDVPNFESGELLVYYKKDGIVKHKTIIMSEAYDNYKNSKTDKDQLSVSGFDTNKTFQANERNKIFTMTLKINIANADAGYNEFTLDVEYTIYANENELKAAKSSVNILNKINTILSDILTPIILVVCSVGVVFAIFLGIRMARANNAEEREEAKKRVIYTIVAIAVGVMLIIMFQVFAKSSIGWFGLSDTADFFPYMPSAK